MNIPQFQTRPGDRGGFSLFELVIAIAIGSMVLVSIFKIADGAVQSTTQMVEFQDEDITRDAFFSFLRDHFDSLPGNAVLDLRATNDYEPYTSEMTFQNTPVSFNWGGVPFEAQATRLITVPTITNGVDVVLEYYDQPILDSNEGPAELGIEPIASVTLLYDVRLFEWTVLDVRQYENLERDEWPIEWNSRNELPDYVELSIVFQAGDPITRRLFWIPTKANPESTMAALQNAARGARQNAANQPGGGGGGPQVRPDRPNNPTGGGGNPRGGGRGGNNGQGGGPGGR
jgi:prepilin-type N-terminal cleavage/methylation domain-containing protein